MDIPFSTIAELGRAYDQRELSPVEVTRALLDRVATHDGKLNSFIRVTDDVALAEAKAAEAELMAGERRGPLQIEPRQQLVYPSQAAHEPQVHEHQDEDREQRPVEAPEHRAG